MQWSIRTSGARPTAPPRTALRLEKGRQLRAFVGDEDGDQFGPLGVARVGGDAMDGAHRLEEGLADVEYLNRAVVELRLDLALGDVGRHGPAVTMRRREAARSIGHADDRH